ncbi:glycosyltransferase family 4 protein [Gulosibacter molinativorax]|uniref:D-inositol 3-phosphate glycosyltransferase n=1 Tax=Gulosibacter molinativorax TaxID=256821 RepID=A0ABT7C9D5_9MICO|nr:glycosyltransferase family 1 protein [Gulosibacter molinativorax]MDJ1371352.1 glycosyltransferase family 1 protein [Gulosibacter molinativorax]
MRVAVVTESFLPTVNGVTNSVKKVLDHLALRGHDAIVICPAAGAPTEYAGFPVHEVATFNYREFPVGLPTPQVQRILDDFKPDVLHAASPAFLGGHAISAARRRGIPSVAIFQTDVAGYSERNGLGFMRDATWSLFRMVHNQADLTLAPSTASIRDLARQRIERVERWGRGVDLVTYHPDNRLEEDARALRAAIARPDEVVIGYVGRLAPEKQVERLAQLRGIPNIQVAVVGDGPSSDVLQEKLRHIPVHFLGRKGGRELAMAYATFDVFVHTGTEETFGQTLQEAHASGTPVVAPLAGGPIDLVTHGGDGYLFDPDVSRGSDSMRRYVARLASDPALRARMGEAGRRRVIGRSWERICDELLGHYKFVIAQKRGDLAPAISASTQIR